MRQIILDTETTGLDHRLGHRMTEIGCIELIERRPSGRKFHRYLNPEREIDAGALQITGLTNEFLADKPKFREIAAEMIEFIQGAELVIHNAEFDVGFLNAELDRLERPLGKIHDHCTVLDTLKMARERYPGQRNSLDALCKRLGVDNTHRNLHGALLDAELLMEVYLHLTAGQGDLAFADADEQATATRRTTRTRAPVAVRVRRAGEADLAAHAARLAALDKASKGQCLWLQLEPAG